MSTIDPSSAGAGTPPTPTREVPSSVNANKPRRARQFRPLFSAGSLHVVLAIVSLLMALPFTWMVLTSLKDRGDVDKEEMIPPRQVMSVDEDGQPVMGRFRTENYVNVSDTENPDPNNRGIEFWRNYGNSLFVAGWVTLLQVVTSAMAAFSFARLKWRGRDALFLMYLSTMMLPGLVMMIPNFQIMISLGWVDTFTGLIVTAGFSAFGTFLMRQFMLTIPASIDEAAEIDGASKWRLFWDIILPLSRPGLITLTIFTFMGNYNSFFWPLVMLRSSAKYTLPLGLMYFDSSRGNSTHLLMAAVTMSVIPMILIFVLLQKYLVKGIQLGAVKG